MRSADLPWGLPGLKPALLTQLRVATLLLQAFLLVFTALVRRGGAAVLEHPAEPVRPQRCSIWRLAAVRALRRHPDVARLLVHQGPLGQASLKPTHLLCLRVPTLPARLAAEADPSWQPTQVSVGKGPDGKFRTAILKEYPPRMCKAFAGAFQDALLTASVQEPQCSDAELTDMRAAAEEIGALVMPLTVGDLGADYARDAAAALPAAPVPWEQLAPAAGAGQVRAQRMPHGLDVRARRVRRPGAAAQAA